MVSETKLLFLAETPKGPEYTYIYREFSGSFALFGPPWAFLGLPGPSWASLGSRLLQALDDPREGTKFPVALGLPAALAAPEPAPPETRR